MVKLCQVVPTEALEVNEKEELKNLLSVVNSPFYVIEDRGIFTYLKIRNCQFSQLKKS